jgi:hypothetical protein
LGYNENPYERNAMKGYKKNYTKVEDLMIDDCIKVAGLTYRVNQIEKIGTAYLIQFHSIFRPKITGILTFEKNTLMTIWNQK